MKRIAYHDEDPDGWMSAAIILHRFPDAKMYQVSKKGADRLDLESGFDEVYVVDHGLWNEENLRRLKSQNKKLIWIDHHKSSIDSYATEYEGLRDTNDAACVLTWKYLFPDEPIPKAVFYIGEGDMWRFSDPNTKLFKLYTRTVEFGKEVQEYQKMLSKDDLSQELHIGELLRKYEGNLIEEMYKGGVKRDFLGYKAMVFDGEILRSELGHIACKRNPDIDFSVVRKTEYINEKGEQVYKYSLRSETVDVSKIANRFPNGGGHKAAAGFHSTEVL
ncbi:MAG: DHH family phosphoesterase [Nanoarchaeota archaeon]|nr:DHH family phosphoesterase [Nanoarchaeota archaeon]